MLRVPPASALQAVVSALLSTFGSDVLRLADASSELPGLRTRPGLATWCVWHRGKMHHDFAELVERFPRGAQKPSHKGRRGCPPFQQLFPPSAADARWMRLERCTRLLPHDHDGGGFFIAVLDKVGQHLPGAGALPVGEPEVCVDDSAAVLPDALLALNGEEAEPADSRGAPSTHAAANAMLAVCPAAAAPAPAGAGEAGTATEGGMGAPGIAAGLQHVERTPPAHPHPPADCGVGGERPVALNVLHAHDCATTPAALADALVSGFAPLFGISAPLQAELVDYFGLCDSFPFDLMVARSLQVSAAHSAPPRLFPRVPAHKYPQGYPHLPSQSEGAAPVVPSPLLAHPAASCGAGGSRRP